MREQSESVRIDTLQQALQRVIRDARLPRTLRTALEFYQSNCDNGATPGRQCVLSSDPTVIEQGLWINILRNDESLDWSVEINGHLHEHVTIEVMEALVECAVIVAETSLTGAVPQRPQ
jgi:hypothetical protein